MKLLLHITAEKQKSCFMGVFIQLFFWKKNLFFLNEGKQKSTRINGWYPVEKVKCCKENIWTKVCCVTEHEFRKYGFQTCKYPINLTFKGNNAIPQKPYLFLCHSVKLKNVYIKSSTFLYWNQNPSNGGVAQWVAHFTPNVFDSPSKTHLVFFSKKLPLLLSTDWCQERIRAWFHNQTKINWGT